MPVVCIAAADLGITGAESPAELEADSGARCPGGVDPAGRGPLMKLGDVHAATTPKMSPARAGQPRRRGRDADLHPAPGARGDRRLRAVSVATACLVPGSVAAEVSGLTGTSGDVELDIEHPTGHFTVSLDVQVSDGVVRVGGPACCAPPGC